MRWEPNTTSYALLSLLDLRPWSTYELAKQMERSLRWFWPRAESVLYEEPKRLVRHGLATASDESTGGRPRTVYRITPAGRAALDEWLSRPGGGPVLEFEAMVQIAFADVGTKEQLLATLAAVREHAERFRELALSRAAEYAETGGPYPERLHVIGLTGKLLLEWTDLLARWAAWAEREAHAMPTIQSGRGVPPPSGAFELGGL